MSAASGNRPDNVAKARLAWGATIPEWIIVLAEACNRESQAAVARKVGYSASAVSQVLSNSYHNGDIARFEQASRGALMSETVTCPVMGEMARNVCLSWQRKPFATTNAHRVRMHQACRTGCPHSLIKGGGDAE
ncbi:transcriptional regulator [Stappia sp. F7233]|uniref:Transcriptional regulator n=1 Tax=Stappia albiluteola TaxID=2758565 RepID=A0A839AG91_9HYPH|nr:transcriptional regulator [Stappia albiluteola]MBA5777444.1 transcriptional regulator [Stappia albiluteola]MBA5777482.1 transcriptional regulator [Stappia albiluteola]MBA5778107.1 transcriptional regulator [Stappia albiluteola]MBA5778116.1 transcriptional regulator [Stappia albiluteola]